MDEGEKATKEETPPAQCSSMIREHGTELQNERDESEESCRERVILKKLGFTERDDGVWKCFGLIYHWKQKVDLAHEQKNAKRQADTGPKEVKEEE